MNANTLCAECGHEKSLHGIGDRITQGEPDACFKIKPIASGATGLFCLCKAFRPANHNADDGKVATIFTCAHGERGCPRCSEQILDLAAEVEELKAALRKIGKETHETWTAKLVYRALAPSVTCQCGWKGSSVDLRERGELGELHCPKCNDKYQALTAKEAVE